MLNINLNVLKTAENARDQSEFHLNEDPSKLLSEPMNNLPASAGREDPHARKLGFSVIRTGFPPLGRNCRIQHLRLRLMRQCLYREIKNEEREREIKRERGRKREKLEDVYSLKKREVVDATEYWTWTLGEHSRSGNDGRERERGRTTFVDEF